jgi:hypothetical protein
MHDREVTSLSIVSRELSAPGPHCFRHVPFTAESRHVSGRRGGPLRAIRFVFIKCGERVCFTPDSGTKADIAEGPRRATSGHHGWYFQQNPLPSWKARLLPLGRIARSGAKRLAGIHLDQHVSAGDIVDADLLGGCPKCP